MAKGKYQRWLLPEGLTLLKGWARDGLTDDQIAKNCGVSRSTLSQWKVSFPDISDALKKGKEIVDYEVENALLKRALGYEVEETKEEDSPDGFKSITTKRHIPGDPTAQIFWLKNRRPDKWRDRREGAAFNEQEQAEAISVFLSAVRPAPADLEALYAEEK
ncbi:MAG: helix-turn-helix domain-containing protein [Oscillospiraceae bacterium]|nr:helix-turn-helix domain-containing protein [Oscillospiraceae bacterium]